MIDLGEKQKPSLENSRVVRSHSICLASDRKASHLMPTWQDFDVMDSLIAALGPLAELTDALAVEKHVTICSLLTRLSQEFLKKKVTDISLTAKMKRTVRVDLEDRYGDSQLSLLLDVWIHLDPRFQQAEPEPGVLVNT